jgi:hypothetical protein
MLQKILSFFFWEKRFKDLYGFQDDVSQAYINQLLSVWADQPMWNFYETVFPQKNILSAVETSLSKLTLFN